MTDRVYVKKPPNSGGTNVRIAPSEGILYGYFRYFILERGLFLPVIETTDVYHTGSYVFGDIPTDLMGSALLGLCPPHARTDSAKLEDSTRVRLVQTYPEYFTAIGDSKSVALGFLKYILRLPVSHRVLEGFTIVNDMGRYLSMVTKECSIEEFIELYEEVRDSENTFALYMYRTEFAELALDNILKRFL